MFGKKKPAVNAAQKPAPSSTLATPGPAPVWKPRLSRETFLGLIVAGTCLALVCGVLVVKKFLVSPATIAESQVVAQNSKEQWEPALPPAPAPRVTPLPPVEMPATVVADVQLTPPPSPIQPVSAETPMIPDAFPIAPIAPPMEPAKNNPAPTAIDPVILPVEPMKKDAPVIAIDPVVLPVEPMNKNNAFVAPPPPDAPNQPARPVAPAKDDFSSKPKSEPKLDPLDLPPVVDPVKPTAKNPVIHVGGTEKKDGPPPIESPPVIVPPTIEPVLKKDPAPLTITPPTKFEAPGIDPPTKKDPPAIEPPSRIELPSEPPVKKTPTAIELMPLKKIEPSKVDTPSPADGKKDGEFDEDLHSLKQNESYRSLSKQYYNSEAYAIALQRYNKDHPGQADYVRIPPIWVLEKKYAGDIAANQARAVNFTAPPAADAAPRNDPVYTVSDNGEMLAEIARKQLGSEESWKRIWDLNPQLNPAKTIPGGTRLRMPGQ